MVNVIADCFRHSPHIVAEDFYTFQLLSLFAPWCGKVESAVLGDTKFQNAYYTHFMSQCFQCLSLFQAEKAAMRQEERREFEDVHQVQYSFQLLMLRFCMESVQKASMKALARRALVMRGIL